MRIDENSIIKLDKNILISEIDKKYVVFNASDGVYSTINSSAKFILDLLTKDQCVKDLSARLATEYNITKEQASIDILDFLNLLIKKKFITID